MVNPQNRNLSELNTCFFSSFDRLPHRVSHINFNLYHYAGNNPVKYFDPDGKEITPEFTEKFGEYDYLPRAGTIDTGNNVADYLLAGWASWWNFLAGCTAVVTNGIGTVFELTEEAIDYLDETIPYEYTLTGCGFRQDLYAIEMVAASNPELFAEALTCMSETVNYTNVMSRSTGVRKPLKADGCFIAGTLVSSKNGLVPIESLKEGDFVYAYNELSDEVELQKVSKTFTHEVNKLVIIKFANREIVTTQIHPLWVNEKGWTLAGNIDVCDSLKTRDSKSIPVESIKIKITEQPVLVYNIEVENAHTYFVGDNEILVHNKAAKNPYRPKTRGANANDRKMIERMAKEQGIDRWKFGDFIEDTKDLNGMGHSETFTWDELKKYAEEFKEYGDVGK